MNIAVEECDTYVEIIPDTHLVFTEILNTLIEVESDYRFGERLSKELLGPPTTTIVLYKETKDDIEFIEQFIDYIYNL